MEKIERDVPANLGRDHLEQISRDHNLTIKGKQSIDITGCQSVSVTGNVSEAYKANHSEEVTSSYYLKGQNVVIEAGTGLSIKVGGNFITIDMSDPTRPVEAGRWWIPGMNAAAGETPSWPATRRFGLHHAIIDGDTAYAAWRDAGMVVLDVADRAHPKLITHRDGVPPFGGGTHNCLPLPDRQLLVVLDEAVLDHQEDGVKNIWVIDNRDKSNPACIATFPQPGEADASHGDQPR